MNVNILDLLEVVNSSGVENFYRDIEKLLGEGKKEFIITANPEIIMQGRHNLKMNEILRNANVIPDGIGVVKALRLVGKNAQRNTGIEFVNFLLNTANKNKLRVFIYGSREKVLQDFKRVVDKRWPSIVFCGLYNGYDSDRALVVEMIKREKPDIIFVALGTPAQELFIDSFYKEISKGICVGIGGSIDVLSGNVKRAPEFFLKYNLEWLYRITKEPKRLKRFWSGNIVFVYVVIRDYILKKSCAIFSKFGS